MREGCILALFLGSHFWALKSMLFSFFSDRKNSEYCARPSYGGERHALLVVACLGLKSRSSWTQTMIFRRRQGYPGQFRELDPMKATPTPRRQPNNQNSHRSKQRNKQSSNLLGRSGAFRERSGASRGVFWIYVGSNRCRTRAQ